MAEIPVPYSPDMDIPLVELPDSLDERVQQLVAAATNFKQLLRDALPGSPYVEQAVRYVDLAVQAGYQAAQDSTPVATEEPLP